MPHSPFLFGCGSSIPSNFADRSRPQALHLGDRGVGEKVARILCRGRCDLNGKPVESKPEKPSMSQHCVTMGALRDNRPPVLCSKTASVIIARRRSGRPGQLTLFCVRCWDWTIHFAPCLGFFQIGRGSAGFNTSRIRWCFFGKISRG
jgi:hypothetical protein